MGRKSKRNRTGIPLVLWIALATGMLALGICIGVAISPSRKAWREGLFTGEPTLLPTAEATLLPTAETDPPSTAAPTPIPTAEPTSTPTPAPTPTPTPEPTPTPKPLEGFVVGIDPGHQLKKDDGQEPVAPGRKETKSRVSSGTYGRFSGRKEYEVNLLVGLKLRDILEEAGATVIMTRETHDVRISNAERARLFNEYNVDLALRIHCNGVENSKVKGAFMLVPGDTEYPYYEACIEAAQLILDNYLEATGFENRKGITYREDMAGFNWCERPICLIEMGHMTNKEDDLAMADDAFQYKMAEGLFNGIYAYLLGG